MQCLQMLENLGIALSGEKKGFVEHNGSYPNATAMGEGLGSGKDFRDLIRIKKTMKQDCGIQLPAEKRP